MQKIFTLLCMVVCASSAGQSQQKQNDLRIHTLSISVTADLFTARTEMEIEMYNPNETVLDGEINFSLAPGQVVTGFALDINGKLREGVIVTKQKARVAYENVIRQKVDPGLLEMTEGNNFRLRVYPVNAKASRRVKIIIHQVLKAVENRLDYYLPLQFKQAVGHCKINVLVKGKGTLPFTGEGILGQSSFVFQEENSHARFTATNIPVDRPVFFSIPLRNDETIACKGRDNYFLARMKLPSGPVVIHKPSSITVFWDVSSSGKKRDLGKDIDFLNGYLEMYEPGSMQLVCFSNEVHTAVTYKNPKEKKGEIRQYLQALEYDGGTQLGALDCSQYMADAYFLFSDGVSNLGKAEMKIPLQPVHCILSSSESNAGALKYISRKSGGSFISLLGISPPEALEIFRKISAEEIKLTAGKNISGMLYTVSGGHVLVSGQLIATDKKIMVQVKRGDKGSIESMEIDPGRECDSQNLKPVWDLLQWEQVLEEGFRTEKRAGELAQQNKYVSTATSFIVLDNIDDYFRFGILPPPDLMDAYNEKYMVQVQSEEDSKKMAAAKEIMFLKRSVASYNSRIAWWDKSAPPINTDLLSYKKIEQPVQTDAGIKRDDAMQERESTSEFSFKGSSSALDEVVVTGYGAARRRSMMGSAVTIQGNQLSSSQNLVQALQGRVSGVVVYPNVGVAGAGAVIRMRGAAALDNSAQPLFVLDGMEIDPSEATTMNMGDIESVTVIKDASAASIYGSRAANGVIVMTSKRPRAGTVDPGIPKYKDLEDVDYILELKDIPKGDKYGHYLGVKESEPGKQPAFYFDVAEHLFASGLKKEAMRVLSNLAELQAENHQLLRAMAYMMEAWGEHEAALIVYQKVFAIKEEEPQSYRDLALALQHTGRYQEAAETIYEVLMKDWEWYEDRYDGLRGILLHELNEIISLNGKKMDLTQFNPEIIRPLPVDLRIVIDWNKDETDIDLHIEEPGGEECFYSNEETKSGGKISEDFTNGYGPEEYEIRQAKKGLYKIRVNYYGDRYQKVQVPSFIKVTIYKNYGRANQEMKIQTLIMDGQNGKIEIGNVRM